MTDQSGNTPSNSTPDPQGQGHAYAPPAGSAPGYQAPGSLPPQAPYGAQSPYAPAPQSQQQPQSPYGAQPPYGAQSPYAQQGQQPYPGGYAQHPQSAYQQAPQPYPYGYAAQPPASYQRPQQRSSLLGLIALAVVAVTAIVGVVLAFNFGHALSSVLIATGIDPTDPNAAQQLQDNPAFRQFALSNAGAVNGIGFASLAGIAGWVVGIVAAATRRGRLWGIVAIILGILAPVAMIAAMVVGMMPALG